MKEINFSTNNFIKSYQYYAFPLGILSYDNISYNQWLLGRFIGISCGEVLQYDEQAYDDWDIINEQLYKSLDVDTFDILIKNIIDNDKAFHLWGINEKHIPYTAAYENYDCLHDLLILGYNEYNHILIANYGKDRILSKKLISIQSLKDSFTNYTQGRSFNFIKENIKIMDFKEMLNSIKQYISPDNNHRLKYYDKELNSELKIVVGISALKKFLETLKKDFNQIHHINSISLLNEHKHLILNTLIYLYDQNIIDNSIIQEYKDVVYLSGIIKNQYLKFLIKSSDKLKNQIILNIEEVIVKEANILSRLFIK